MYIILTDVAGAARANTTNAKTSAIPVAILYENWLEGTSIRGVHMTSFNM